MDKEEFITITHFINPQMFWYHKVDGQNPTFAELQRIEESVQSLFTAKQSVALRPHRPEVGEIVAVAFVSWNKYIRARVEYIAKYIKGDDEYIVWALDYGFPFRTKLCYIRKLPSTHVQPADHIRLGGVANVLPAELDFDFVTTTSKLVTKQSWSQRAIEMLEKILMDAASISFIKSFSAPAVSGTHHFGDLKIINHSGTEFFASDFLSKLNYALKCESGFKDKLATLKPTKVPCWETNGNDKKIIENKLNQLNMHYLHQGKFNLSGSLSEGSCDNLSKQKVMDWCERNQNLNNKDMDASGLCATSALDAADISFDDSVSVKNNTTGNYPGNDESVMGYGGAIHENRRKKYQEKVLPPKPSLEEFQMFSDKKPLKEEQGDSNKSSGSTTSVPSQRTKALIEMRKKHKKIWEERKNESIPYENLAKLEINSTSDAGTEEFLEKCKKKNAVSARLERLKELRQRRAEDVQSSLASTSEFTEQNNKVSPTSSRHLLLKRIKDTHLKHDAEDWTKRDDAASASVSNVDTVTDVQSQSGSRISAHAAKLISMRRKIREKHLQEEEASLAEQTTGTTSTKQGYKMPPNNPRLTKIDFSSHTQTHWEPEKTKGPKSGDENFNFESDVSCKKPTAREIELRNLRKTIQENPFKDMTMVPAGFDVTKLVQRHNEDHHWHTKKTTLNDSLHSVCSSNSESDKRSVPRRTEDEEQQDFRLTMSRKERKKDTFEKHPLDLSLSDSGCAPAITPQVVGGIKATDEVPQDLLVMIDDDKEDGESNVTLKNSCLKRIDLADQALDLSTASSDSFLKFVNAGVSVKNTSRENLLDTSQRTSEDSLDSVRPTACTKVNEEKVNSKDSSSSISSSSFSKVGSVIQGLDDCGEVPKKASNASNVSISKQCAKNVEDDSTVKSVRIENYRHPMDFLGSEKGSRSSSSSASSLVKVRNNAQNQKAKNSLMNQAMPLSSSSSSPAARLRKNLHVDSQSSSSSSVAKQVNSESAVRLPEFAGESPLKTNFIEHLVLAHSNVKVTPIERMNSALFSSEIHREMENMRLTKMYRIQSYAWAHLVRGNSFFVINSSRTGKTWCYLPPLCSMVSFRLEMKVIPKSYGPVAVIIAPSSVEVESITRQCRRLLSSTQTKVSVVPSYAFRNAEDVKIELHNGCGILIITPPSLQRLLVANESEPLLNMGRISYIVIDDLDTQLMKDNECEATLQKFIGPFLHQQESGKVPFQIVVTSKKWSRRLINLLRISNQPLLCIADYLEAAVYAKAKISIKLQSSQEKMAVMMKYLEGCAYALERVIIVCSTPGEVEEVEKTLLDKGYACLAYTDLMPVETSNLINEWKLKSVCHQILVTVDAVLPEVMVQNAWILIHYSLPKSWTKFTFRFSTFLKNHVNMLSKNFAKPEKVPKSLILLDENNNLQLPRLIEFMKHHDQLKHIHPDILSVVAKVTAEREESRVSQGILMCPKILEFGSCDETTRCSYRHQLTKYDGPTNGIPTQGLLRVKILDVLSPTHYTARLLRQRVSSEWEVAMRSDMVPQFLMQLSFHFLNDAAHVIHWPLRVNDLCVYKGEGIFHRCRLLEVPPVAHENIVKQVNVKVKLIDSGPSLMCKSHDLLVLPEKFRDFPPQAVDIRLSGVVPFDNERVWDSRSTRAVKKWIMTDVTDNDCLEASINFALMDTLWVHNIVLMERLPAISGFAVKTNVRRSLLGKEFALADNGVHLVKATAIENGLLDISPSTKREEQPTEEKREEKNLLDFSTSTSVGGGDVSTTEVRQPKLAKQVSPRPAEKPSAPKPKVPAVITEEWAKLELEELVHVKVSQLHNPSMFYVRALKKNEELEELEDLIQHHTKVPLEDAHPMQNCLAPHDGRYHRGKILRLLIDSAEGGVQARVFFCDLGFFSNFPLDQLRASNRMFTEFMPFQAICCRLIGIRVESVGPKIQDIIKVEDSAHLAYAVKEVFNSEDAFDTHNYTIILYECFSDKNDIQINKLLVERGLASYDNDTKHYLEFEAKFSHTSYDDPQDEETEPYDFQAFLDRIRQQMDEEDAEEEHVVCNPPLRALMDAQDNEPKIVEIPSTPPPKLVPKPTTETAPSPVTKIDPAIPPLKALHKRPQTTWYETMCMIFLVIKAPDITDYHLEVTPKQLIFVANVNGEQQMLILNLMGYVDPSKVMHEIRGLNVIVRLVKSLHMEWPRLLENPTKYSWLTYNFNALNTVEVEKMIEGASRPKRTRMISYSSETSDSSNSNPCETFTPIVNTDQLHDPMEEYF